MPEDRKQRNQGLAGRRCPQLEARTGWIAKECVHDIDLSRDPNTDLARFCQLATNLQNEAPPEIRQLGRTLHRLSTQIAAWHSSWVSHFAHYRIRALLYAGGPNWDLLLTRKTVSNPITRQTSIRLPALVGLLTIGPLCTPSRGPRRGGTASANATDPYAGVCRGLQSRRQVGLDGASAAPINAPEKVSGTTPNR